MNLDVDSLIKVVIEDALNGRHRLLVMALFIVLFLINYNCITTLMVMETPSLIDAFWSTSASKLFVNMAKLEVFDKTFVIAGEMFAIVLTYAFAVIFSTQRRWALYILLFQDNLKIYRKSISPTKSITDLESKNPRNFDRGSMLTYLMGILSKSAPICFRQFILLAKRQELMVNFRFFSDNRCRLPLYSNRTLIQTAVITDFVAFFMNLFGPGFFLCTCILCPLMRFYFRFGETYGIFINLFIFPILILIALEFAIFGSMQQTIAMVFHILELNGPLKEFVKEKRLSSLRTGSADDGRSKKIIRISVLWSFICRNVQTSTDLENNTNPQLILLWFYWLVLFNAYLLYRMFFLYGPWLFQLINFLFFFGTAVASFYSFAVLMFIHKGFYKYRKFFPGLIAGISRKEYFAMKVKAVHFYEHQNSKKFKSGFKMYPSVIVNSQTLLKFIFLYIIIVLQLCKFYFKKKTSA